MASQEAMDKYLDSLNQAMAMHAAAAVQNLKFNKTEIAEIVDNTNRNEGWYVVSNGAFKYNAFSENTTYTIGMQVHVNIPNNDYTGQKTIIGQYKREGEQGVWYRSPWENFSPDVNNIILDTLYKDAGSENTTEGKLVANWDLTVTNSNEVPTEEGPKAQSIVLYRSDSLNDANKIKQRSYQDYKFLGIKADFKTLFSELNVGSGDYGIRVTLQYVRRDDTIENVDYTYQVITLSTEDMVGSIYNFNTYYTQEALYELQKDENSALNAINIELYQDGNFLTKKGEVVDYFYEMGEENRINNPNILMRGLDVRFGNDPIDKDNEAQIYTTNGLTYDSAQKDSLSSKHIYLRWNHLNSTTKIIEKAENASEAANLTEVENYKIHWYKDSIHTANEYLEILDEENNKYKEQDDLINRWKEAESKPDDQLSLEEKKAIRKELIDSFNLSTDLYNADDYTISAAGEAQINQSLRASVRSATKTRDVLAGSFWEPLDVSETSFEITFQPDNNKTTSKVMAIIEYGPMKEDGYDTTSYEYHMIKSNIIEFTNGRDIPDNATSDQFNGLKVYFEDNSDGNYPLYSGTTNEVLNRSDITRTRKLRAEYYSTGNGESYFNGNETIIWKIPVINTMIVMSESFYDSLEERIFENDPVFTNYKSIIGDFDANYMYLKRSVENSSTSVETTQEYQIDRFYKKSAVNNSVYCYVIKNNQMAKTSVTMYFSQHGTSGTDYTFSLGLGSLYEINDAEWVEVGPPDTAITLNDEYYREIVFELYDSKNEKIDLTDDQKNGIIDSWITSSNNGYYNKGNIENLIGTTNDNRIEYKIIENDNKKIRFAIRAISGTKISTITNTYKSLQSGIDSYIKATDELNELYKKVEKAEKIISESTKKKAVLQTEFETEDDENKKNTLEAKIYEYDQIIKKYNDYINLYREDKANWKVLVDDTVRNLHHWTEEYNRYSENYFKPFRYIILKAVVWSNVINDDSSTSKRVKFEQYLPLHFRAEDSLWCLQGGDSIIYDDKGTNPFCYNDVYKIIDGKTGLAVPMNYTDTIDSQQVLMENLHIYVDDNITDEQLPNENGVYEKWNYPYFKLVEEENGVFQKMVVPSMYLSDQSKNICIEAPGIYTCPLLIIQNKYQIPALNEWDGELLVDGTKNEVLAAMIGAGHKNNDNTFTGVVMGDVTHSDSKLSGLFGYNTGARVFELNTNGEAFIGKSGNGRIYIDGNTGTIKSSAREASTTQGTEFNLKENYIDVRSSDGKSSRIHLDTKIRSSDDGGTNAYFSVDNENGARLINIANDNYYLQTANYSDTNKTGLKINLKDGVFNSYGKITINGGSGSSINFGTGSSINSTGTLTITGNDNSSIRFGNAFKVEKNPDNTNGGSGMAVSLGNLNFIDSNGNFLKEGTGNNARTATNIKPKWMTFVTDITGSVALQKVTVTIDNVTCKVDVNDTVTTTTVNRTRNITSGTTSHHFYSTSSMNAGNGSSVTDVVDRVDSPNLGDGTQTYEHKLTINYAYPLDTYTTESNTVNNTTTRTATGSGTGSTDVPVVTAINFTIKKVSMWALTNSSATEKSYSINAKGTGGTYTGTVETHTMEEVTQ